MLQKKTTMGFISTKFLLKCNFLLAIIDISFHFLTYVSYTSFTPNNYAMHSFTPASVGHSLNLLACGNYLRKSEHPHMYYLWLVDWYPSSLTHFGWFYHFCFCTHVPLLKQGDEEHPSKLLVDDPWCRNFPRWFTSRVIVRTLLLMFPLKLLLMFRSFFMHFGQLWPEQSHSERSTLRLRRLDWMVSSKLCAALTDLKRNP